MCERTKNGKNVVIDGIDSCLYPFIKLLNRNNVETEFCCCGHGSDNPNISFESWKNISKLLKLLGQYSSHVIEKIKVVDGNRWQVKFNGLICSPPRYPCWVDSKEQIEFVKMMRKKIFKGS